MVKPSQTLTCCYLLRKWSFLGLQLTPLFRQLLQRHIHLPDQTGDTKCACFLDGKTQPDTHWYLLLENSRSPSKVLSGKAIKIHLVYLVCCTTNTSI